MRTYLNAAREMVIKRDGSISPGGKIDTWLNEKHGVSFEETATIFSDPEALDWEDTDHSETEKRFKRLGMSIGKRIFLVVYTVRRLKNGKETRIISARQASRKERKAYSG